jgi:phenylpyruvate tautomerase PptA (4-oxalocrotonate tautomerase family)
MPEVYIHAIEGRTKKRKRALIKDITDAVQAVLQLLRGEADTKR